MNSSILKTLITSSMFLLFFGVFSANAAETYRIGCIKQSQSLSGADQRMAPVADLARSVAMKLEGKIPGEEGLYRPNEYTPDAYRCYIRFTKNPPLCTSARLAAPDNTTFSIPGAKAGTMCHFDDAHAPLLRKLSSTRQDGSQRRITDFPEAKIFGDWSQAYEYLDSDSEKESKMGLQTSE